MIELEKITDDLPNLQKKNKKNMRATDLSNIYLTDFI